MKGHITRSYTKKKFQQDKIRTHQEKMLIQKIIQHQHKNEVEHTQKMIQQNYKNDSELSQKTKIIQHQHKNEAEHTQNMNQHKHINDPKSR